MEKVSLEQKSLHSTAWGLQGSWRKHVMPPRNFFTSSSRCCCWRWERLVVQGTRYGEWHKHQYLTEDLFESLNLLMMIVIRRIWRHAAYHISERILMGRACKLMRVFDDEQIMQINNNNEQTKKRLCWRQQTTLITYQQAMPPKGPVPCFFLLWVFEHVSQLGSHNKWPEDGGN